MPGQHAERFALMWYACKCGHRERLWNLRDGVTPFGLGCPSCGGLELMHVDWKRDEAAPGHRLNRGQRFFRDGTAADAKAILRRRFELYPAPDEVQASLFADAEEQTGEWLPGWPMIDVQT